MKSLNYSLLIIFLLCSFSSFSQEKESPSKPKTVNASFIGQKVKAQLIGTANTISTEDAEAQMIQNLNNVLMGAEKEAKFLDLVILIPRNPIHDNLFVFALESQKAQTLSVEIYDEEGFNTIANCTFDVNTIGGFFAIELKDIEEGNYYFRLKDDDGAELNRVFTISEK